MSSLNKSYLRKIFYKNITIIRIRRARIQEIEKDKTKNTEKRNIRKNLCER